MNNDAKPNNTIDRVRHEELVSRLEQEDFFGVLETHFESGRIVRLKKNETLVRKDIDRLIQK